MRSVFHDRRGFTILETIMVVALTAVIAVIAIPMTASTIANFRLTGDVRGAANTVALAKMRASAVFAKQRMYIDLGAKSYHRETWSAGAWATEGGTISLSQGVTFGFGVVGTAPPNTTAGIGQAPACKDAANNDIGNTACIIFNSRGAPIDTTGAPVIDDVYITDGTAVYSITVSATGLIRTWRTLPLTTPTWVLQ